MHVATIVLLCNAACAIATMATGQLLSFNALKQVMERQIHFCTPVPLPATCAKSCGSGYIQCVSFPTCYNPSLGQTCCSNGRYCEAGYYCTNAGCCPNGTPLARCGATISLSVLPPVFETTTFPSEPTFTSTLATITSSTEVESTEVAMSESSTTSISRTSSTEIFEPPTSTETDIPTEVTPTTTSPEPPSETSAVSNATAPIQVVPGAGQKLNLSFLHVGVAVAAVLFFIM